ncbi:GNAT family N-acetyltransferase [Microbulbifer sp. TB1203]|uniref:GNAT family N-acetyltransferase n=1 Tax=unclassified Microbulbifer TaxID=2619833 RepID=UPI0035AF1530
MASGDAGPRFLIAYRNEGALGLIGGVYSNGEYELVSMWVNPVVRGLGVGLELVKALQSHVLSESHLSVALKVSTANKSARNLYLKAGFVVIGEAGALNTDGRLQKMVWHHSAKP